MTKLTERGLGFILGCSMLTIAAAITPSVLHAQAGGEATVHGKILDPGGNPFGRGDVKFTTDKSTPEPKRIYRYTFPVAKDGTYTATGVVPADYLIVVYADGKTVDFQEVTIKLKDDKTVDFDMTREEYLKAMTPEARAALEATKKKNAAAMAENAKIADVNKTLLKAKDDEKNGHSLDAVNELKPLTTQKADEPIVWAALGHAQLSNADADSAAAKAAKTTTKTPEILQKYADSAASFQKAIDLYKAKPKQDPATMFSYYLNEGQAFAHSGKTDEAIAAYDSAAAANPAQGASAFFNESVVLYSANKLPEAAAAADKSIALDPKRAEAYYIKGASLVGNATVDPKTNKFVLPPGCLEAYQQYLNLDPTGSHAADVKGLLDSLGQPQRAGYKAPPKK